MVATQKTQNSSPGTSPATQNNWYGLTYEKVAMAHIPQILRAIGMDRILTEYYSWRSQSSDPGAQIDLIIDRADGFLNLCEVKYAKGDYALTKAEAEKIDNRVSAFQQETSTDKNILVTLNCGYISCPGPWTWSTLLLPRPNIVTLPLLTPPQPPLFPIV